MSITFQFVRFNLVGVISTIAHVSVALAIEALGLAPAILANLFGFFAAFLISYFGHSKFTFHARLEHKTHLPKFLTIALIGLAVSSFITLNAHYRMGYSFVLTMAIVGIVVPIFTFLSLKLWVFATDVDGMEYRSTERSAHRFGMFVQMACLLILSLAVVSNFTNLQANSFWLDELFTAYFADPTVASFSEFLGRVSEDVHPLGYYSVVWLGARTLPLDFDLMSRGVSAVAATILLPLLYVSFPVWVGRTARLLACAMAATSIAYYDFAQEARSYALLWIPITALTWVALQMSRDVVAGAPLNGHKLGVFFMLGVASCVTHYYALPINGAFILVLITLCSSWQNRIRLCLLGLAILGAVYAYTRWHLPNIVVNADNTWFETQPFFLFLHVGGGLKLLFGIGVQYWFSLTLFLLGFFALLKSFEHVSQRGTDSAYPQVALVIRVLFFSVALALLITIVYRPIFSYRFMAAVAPIFWILYGLFFEAIVRAIPARIGALIIAISIAVFAIDSARILWRDVERKEPWRQSAQFVEQFQACRGQTLAVGWLDQKHISGNPGERFYGYYLSQSDAYDWATYNWDGYNDLSSNGRVFESLQERLNDQNACPILFWTQDNDLKDGPDEIADKVAAQFGSLQDLRIVVRTFDVENVSAFAKLLGLESGQNNKMFVVLAEGD